MLAYSMQTRPLSQWEVPRGKLDPDVIRVASAVQRVNKWVLRYVVSPCTRGNPNIMQCTAGALFYAWILTKWTPPSDENVSFTVPLVGRPELHAVRAVEMRSAFKAIVSMWQSKLLPQAFKDAFIDKHREELKTVMLYEKIALEQSLKLKTLDDVRGTNQVFEERLMLLLALNVDD